MLVFSELTFAVCPAFFQRGAFLNAENMEGFFFPLGEEIIHTTILRTSVMFYIF